MRLGEGGIFCSFSFGKEGTNELAMSSLKMDGTMNWYPPDATALN